MHINGIIITKQFISHWNFKRLRGSVGRAHIHFGYIFLKSNEKIVVKTPKSTVRGSNLPGLRSKSMPTVHSRYLGSKKPLVGFYHCIDIGSFFFMFLDEYGIKLYIRDAFSN